MNNLFISYSRQNKGLLQFLKKALEDRGISVWIDMEGIRPIAEWRNEIKNAIETSEAILIAISASWIESEECQEELKYALELNKKIIPIIVSATQPEKIPPQVSKLNWISFVDNKFEAFVEIVIDAFKTDLEWVRHHTELLNKAVEWKNNDCNDNFVLSGVQFEKYANAVAKNKDTEPKLTNNQIEFLNASKNHYLSTSVKKSARRARTQVLGKLIGSLKELTGTPTTIDLSSDGLYLAIGTSGSSVHVFYLPTKNQISVMSKHNGRIESVRFISDNQFIVSSDSSGVVWLWQSQNGNIVSKFEGHKGEVKTATVSFDGQYMVTGGSDTILRLWDLETGELISILDEHTDEVVSAEFSPDQSILASASKDGTVRIWDFTYQSSASSKYIITPNTLPIQNVSFSSNSILVILSADDDVSAWDTQSGRLLIQEKLFSPD